VREPIKATRLDYRQEHRWRGHWDDWRAKPEPLTAVVDGFEHVDAGERLHLRGPGPRVLSSPSWDRVPADGIERDCVLLSAEHSGDAILPPAPAATEPATRHRSSAMSRALAAGVPPEVVLRAMRGGLSRPSARGL